MILQAYDFLELNKKNNCVLQVGGSDQWGNIVNGVDLIKRSLQTGIWINYTFDYSSIRSKNGKTEKLVWLDKTIISYDYWQFWRNTDDFN